MKYKVLRQGTRFFGAGLVMLPVGVGVSALCHEVLHLSESAAGAIAFGVLLIMGFLMTRQFVFRSSGNIGTQAWRFLLAATLARGFEYLIFLGLSVVVGFHYLVAFMSALAISFCLKFIVYKSWIFTDSGSAA